MYIKELSHRSMLVMPNDWVRILGHPVRLNVTNLLLYLMLQVLQDLGRRLGLGKSHRHPQQEGRQNHCYLRVDTCKADANLSKLFVFCLPSLSSSSWLPLVVRKQIRRNGNNHNLSVHPIHRRPLSCTTRHPLQCSYQIIISYSYFYLYIY